MNVIFFDRQDKTNGLHGVTIRDTERLFHVLNTLRNRPPFICDLVGENDFHLEIGVGKRGCAQYSRSDGDPPYLLALAPHPERPDEDTEFLLGNTPTPISNHYCMPFPLVREIAGYFLETGRAHPGFVWERV